MFDDEIENKKNIRKKYYSNIVLCEERKFFSIFFSIFFLIFLFHLSILGLLEIKIYNLFQFIFYKVILINVMT